MKRQITLLFASVFALLALTGCNLDVFQDGEDVVFKDPQRPQYEIRYSSEQVRDLEKLLGSKEAVGEYVSREFERRWPIIYTGQALEIESEAQNTLKPSGDITSIIRGVSSLAGQPWIGEAAIGALALGASVYGARERRKRKQADEDNAYSAEVAEHEENLAKVALRGIDLAQDLLDSSVPREEIHSRIVEGMKQFAKAEGVSGKRLKYVIGQTATPRKVAYGVQA